MTCAVPASRPPSLARLARIRDRLARIDRALTGGAPTEPLLARMAVMAAPADPDLDHATRVANLSHAVAQRYGVHAELAAQIRSAAKLHDIGKYALPRGLLLFPGPLSARQREHLALHTRAASWLLDGLEHPVLRLACVIARSHHERWDGRGYPDKIPGPATPSAARLVAVCDVWDALTNDRPYRPALSGDEARAMLRTMRGTSLDPEFTDALLDCIQQ